MPQPAPLFIVASPRPRVGKTLLARLFAEFLRADGRAVTGFDLNPREPTFNSYFPYFASIVDIADTRGQMALFDRLIGNKAAAAAAATVIDLGYGAFETFFSVMTEIGFAQEAQRRNIEPIVLFVTDQAQATARAYGGLRRNLPTTAFVPVHNEAVAVMYEKADFPPSRPEYGLIRIPRLSPIVRGVVDRPSFSFAAYQTEAPGGPTEIHSWIAGIFAEFRELELRLMMSKLGVSLGSTATRLGEILRASR